MSVARLAAFALFFFLLLGGSAAQSPTGTLVTRVEPLATRVYVIGPDGYQEIYFGGDRTLTNMAPGSYMVVATLAGYRLAERKVTIRTGETVEVAFGLQASTYPAFGGTEFGAYAPLEEGVSGGRIILTTPVDYTRDPTVSVVGPDGFRRDFEIEFSTTLNGDNGLLPGMYSVAATDKGVELSEAKVEVRDGQAVTVAIHPVPLKAFAYNLTGYEPFGSFKVEAYEPLVAGSEEANGTGTLIVSTNLGEDARWHLIGPDNFRKGYRGDESLEGLEPGPYSVAATAAGYKLVQGFVEIRVGQSIAVNLTFEPY